MFKQFREKLFQKNYKACKDLPNHLMYLEDVNETFFKNEYDIDCWISNYPNPPFRSYKGLRFRDLTQYIDDDLGTRMYWAPKNMFKAENYPKKVETDVQKLF